MFATLLTFRQVTSISREQIEPNDIRQNYTRKTHCSSDSWKYSSCGCFDMYRLRKLFTYLLLKQQRIGDAVGRYVRCQGCDREKRRRRERSTWGHCAPVASNGRTGDPQTDVSWCNAREIGRTAAAAAVATRPNFRPASGALNPSRNENTEKSFASAAGAGRTFHQFTHGRAAGRRLGSKRATCRMAQALQSECEWSLLPSHRLV